MSLTELIAGATKAWHGVKLGQPDWGEHSHSIAFTARMANEQMLVHLILNAYWEPLEFEVPPATGHVAALDRHVLVFSAGHRGLAGRPHRFTSARTGPDRDPWSCSMLPARERGPSATGRTSISSSCARISKGPVNPKGWLAQRRFSLCQEDRSA